MEPFKEKLKKCWKDPPDEKAKYNILHNSREESLFEQCGRKVAI